MNRPAPSWTRGLRFRLTLTYLVFFAVLLTLLGVVFRQILSSILQAQAREVLEEEWGAVKGYLRIEGGQVQWYFDRADPEEASIVERIRRVFLLTDANGRVLEVSDEFQVIGIESRDEIQQTLQENQPTWTVRQAATGVPYLVRSGSLIDDNRKTYFVAIGRAQQDALRALDQFSWNYFALLPVILTASGVLGWFMAGRALRPVTEVAQTAQRITSSNLDLQIPLRGSGDELDHLIETFNRMVERLRASFTMTKQFSTDVSHELRTPITALRGELELALFTAETTEQYQDAITNALQDVERLSQLVRALLLLSQTESGQVALQKSVLNFTDIVSEIVDQFQILAQDAKITLTGETPTLCLLEADRIQMERLLYNLLANALKYTQEGGSVHVALTATEDQVTLSVADTGRGIAPDHLPHIFDRFYRAPGRKRAGEKSLGLGLSFVAWIVKAHGGEIDVVSEMEKGTTFTVRLPVGNVAPAAEEPVVLPRRDEA